MSRMSSSLRNMVPTKFRKVVRDMHSIEVNSPFILASCGRRPSPSGVPVPGANGFVCVCQTTVCTLKWSAYVPEAGDRFVRSALNT